MYQIVHQTHETVLFTIVKKSIFIKEQGARGLLISIGIKTLLRQITFTFFVLKI